jgi:hypothetical protein
MRRTEECFPRPTLVRCKHLLTVRRFTRIVVEYRGVIFTPSLYCAERARGRTLITAASQRDRSISHSRLGCIDLHQRVVVVGEAATRSQDVLMYLLLSSSRACNRLVGVNVASKEIDSVILTFLR